MLFGREYVKKLGGTTDGEGNQTAVLAVQVLHGGNLADSQLLLQQIASALRGLA